ncbi:ketopantoate reductase family protein [Roseomonas xinghualingensis]|uniref:ketopantoate reductase family protein n=1 Tax=Roseomonas xinghualingensis TaxID=2986475 RepID=UPI0021F1B81E|nr:2-dehydropantoate 2-reductase [Roseomonas sp. SXEYE001]MCV4207943.1 2-dehydropantoate 2-reductase [Roseomonas sp. SXEYE001]
MRICVFGAGAIGGHLAGRLARGGAEVSVIARGSYLAAIREKGLTVEAPDGRFHSRPGATDDPSELGPQDAVVVTVKGQGLPGVAEAIAPLLGPQTSVAFVMNGIPWWYFDRHGGALDGRPLPALDPGGAVRRVIGVERTIGGVVYSACTVTEPGVVHVAAPGNRVILGEPDGRISERAQALSAALEAGGMKSPVVPDIRREVWLKLVANLTSGPLCLLSRQGMQQTLADPALREAARAGMEEGLAIARGLGLAVEMDVAKRVEASAKVAHKPSILQDMEAGKPLEMEAMLVQPLALARLTGVETPVLDLLVALARKAAEATGQYVPAG